MKISKYNNIIVNKNLGLFKINNIFINYENIKNIKRSLNGTTKILFKDGNTLLLKKNIKYIKNSIHKFRNTKYIYFNIIKEINNNNNNTDINYIYYENNFCIIKRKFDIEIYKDNIEKLINNIKKMKEGELYDKG